MSDRLPASRLAAVALCATLASTAALVATSGPSAQAEASGPAALQADVQTFLDDYSALYTALYRTTNASEWAGATDVGPYNDGRRTAAGQAWAAFKGEGRMTARAKAYLDQKAQLTPLQVRQLEAIIHAAGEAPGQLPELVNARIEAESRQASLQDSFKFCLEKSPAGECTRPTTANELDGLLVQSHNLEMRLKAWESSKEIGKLLKPGLVELQSLRNKVARSMGYSSYFGYMVAEYGMTVPEMMALLDGFVTDTAPLYDALHTWAGRQLATRYLQAAPTGPVPAHWVTNRWAQRWVGIVQGMNLDAYLKDRTGEWVVKQSERFYTSMGFDPLPEAFWKHSDLYPLPQGAPRAKNTHASAWNMDLGQDLRSLMSVEPDSRWFFTTHHELGHIYYYMAYNRPEVPVVLREGANRAFHEAVGDLAGIAAGQVPYLRQQGILPPGVKVNPTQFLLNEALEQTIAFLPFAAGTMSHFEYELYEKDLPADQWQARWWAMVQDYQKVAPPSPDRLKDPSLCDACTKTHINDDPAGYYDYAIATVLKYQLHETIATKILKQDPHQCNYFGNKEVGAFLKSILEKGATQDWRVILKEATGEDLSTRAMVAYFEPLKKWLDKENRSWKPARSAGTPNGKR